MEPAKAYPTVSGKPIRDTEVDDPVIEVADRGHLNNQLKCSPESYYDRIARHNNL